MEDSSKGTVPSDGKETPETVQIAGTIMSVSCPPLNAGGGWETGRVGRSRQANGRLKLLLFLKQRAPNRKEEQKPSPVCSSEKAPVRMRLRQPLWLLATAHLPSKQCRLHTAPWSMDSS